MNAQEAPRPWTRADVADLLQQMRPELAEAAWRLRQPGNAPDMVLLLIQERSEWSPFLDAIMAGEEKPAPLSPEMESFAIVALNVDGAELEELSDEVARALERRKRMLPGHFPVLVLLDRLVLLAGVKPEAPAS